MGIEEPKEYTPEEIAELEKSRTISDAELLKDGAEIDEESKRLEVTDEQIEEIKGIRDGQEREKAKMYNEARALIDRVGPHIGGKMYDYTDAAIFPEENNEICAVRRFAENGSNYGYDTVYLVWRDKDGELEYKDIKNTKSTQGYLTIKNVEMDDSDIIVSFYGKDENVRIANPL